MTAAVETTADARYKFVVSSADEAVNVLRERLGEHAKVISVRQIEGAGLARFLRAPKLEVIAKVEIPEPEPVERVIESLWPISPPWLRPPRRKRMRRAWNCPSKRSSDTFYTAPDSTME